MTGAIRIDHLNSKIFISKSFAKASMNATSSEYRDLLKVMQCHPDYEIDRRVIKKRPNKETYPGLTYAYMEYYIEIHDNAELRMAEYKEMRLRAACHEVKYPHIKQWFLGAYPQIDDFTPEDYKNKLSQVNLGKIEATENDEKVAV